MKKIFIFFLFISTVSKADDIGFGLLDNFNNNYLLEFFYAKKIDNTGFVIANFYNSWGYSQGENVLYGNMGLSVGYRYMPFEKWLFLDAGGEYNYIFNELFTQNNFGLMAKVGVKTEGTWYVFVNYKATWYFYESNSYKNTNNTDQDLRHEKNIWQRSQDVQHFLALGIGYSW